MSELNKQVASLIEANMPCGACEQCLEKAIERFFETNDEEERRSLYDPIVEVATTVAEKKGSSETAAFIARKLFYLAGCPIDEAIELGYGILGMQVSVRMGPKLKLKAA